MNVVEYDDDLSWKFRSIHVQIHCILWPLCDLFFFSRRFPCIAVLGRSVLSLLEGVTWHLLPLKLIQSVTWMVISGRFSCMRIVHSTRPGRYFLHLWHLAAATIVRIPAAYKSVIMGVFAIYPRSNLPRVFSTQLLGKYKISARHNTAAEHCQKTTSEFVLLIMRTFKQAINANWLISSSAITRNLPLD